MLNHFINMCVKFSYGMRYIVTEGYLQHVQRWLWFTLKQSARWSLTCLPDRQIQLISHGDTQQSGHEVNLGVSLQVYSKTVDYGQTCDLKNNTNFSYTAQHFWLGSLNFSKATWVRVPKKSQVEYVKQRRLNGYTRLNCYWATKNKNRIHSISWVLKDFCIHIQKSENNLFLKLYSINKSVKKQMKQLFELNKFKLYWKEIFQNITHPLA